MLSVRGQLRVPGDKSISHRSLILAALAEGESDIRGISDAADIRATVTVLRSLGVALPALSTSMRVEGVGLRGLTSPRGALDCGNSGTTARLIAGVVAACDFSARFVGDESLSRRPMKRIAEPLTAMRARFEFEGGDGLPFIVHGGDLKSATWNTGGSSAQVKGAILLAGLVAGVDVRVHEKSLSRDHTERLLRSMGADIRVDRENHVSLHPTARLSPLTIDVPADPSSAAFFVALASLADESELVLSDVCLNSTRTGFLRAMHGMGAIISREDAKTCNGDEVGSLRVLPGILTGIAITEAEVPALIDELPLLACVAAGAGVDLEISGAEELRAKESDRIKTVVSNLIAIGARAEERKDGLRVWGPRRELHGTIDPAGDHRIAMAFGIVGALPGNRIKIESPACVSVSYPTFWNDLKRVVGYCAGSDGCSS
ncbi:MAG: 3-phosphoshikimate 1-carboxyvinyltransferase [Gemmatimonadaceae bacterium]|nr:3-phosphoshikimate 1-carboxyvinyltransferase [Gemmatimonadaceae bacterium]